METNNVNSQSLNQQTLAILTQYQGIASRLSTIFSYHYDQILRECQQELQKLPPAECGHLEDWLTEFMEEHMAWPSNESQLEFNFDLAHIQLSEDE